ncbi:MAG: PqqD family protein [Planctomycetota bacterium]|jgi:hypothetical protein
MTAPHWTSRSAEIVAPLRRGDVAVAEIDGEVVFTDPDNGHTYHLNETAFAVWKRCDGQATTLEIADALTAEYDVDFDTALDDVEQLVVFFARNGLAGIPTSHDSDPD